MADFDPYLKWLGIRDPQRPVNFYRLLGLELFENDPEIIANAADRQMVHVRSYQGGPHGELSQQILSELAVGRRCLLTMNEKVVYDNQLRQAIAESESVSAAVANESGRKDDSKGNIEQAADDFRLVPPEVERRSAAIPNFLNSDQPPAFGGSGAEIGRGKIAVKSTEDLRGKRKRRDKNQLVWTLFAWLTSALAAVAVSAYLLNSGLVAGIGEWFDKESEAVKPDDSESRQRSIPKRDLEELASSGDQKDRGPALLDPNVGKPDPKDSNADPFNIAAGNPDPFNVNSESSSARLPMPLRVELSRAETELQSQYASLMSSASSSSSAKRRLASTMVADVSLAEQGSAFHYALLDHAARNFTQSGDLRNASATLKQLNRAFDIDYWKLIRNAVEEAAKNASKQDEADYKITLDALIDEAVSQGEFDEGSKLIGIAISRASKIRDDRLKEEYQLKRQRLKEQQSRASSP